MHHGASDPDSVAMDERPAETGDHSFDVRFDRLRRPFFSYTKKLEKE
jgi:hypothetical protein